MDEGRSGAARVALVQLRRAGAIDIFRVHGEDTSIADGGAWVSVASFGIPPGHVGVLTAVGHETSHLGWNNIAWRIVLGDDATAAGQPQRGFTSQTGLSWGRTNKPGEVFIDIGNGKTVALQGSQSSGAAILASALLVGYYWSKARPGEK